MGPMLLACAQTSGEGACYLQGITQDRRAQKGPNFLLHQCLLALFAAQLHQP